jgi:putative membrane protein
MERFGLWGFGGVLFGILLIALAVALIVWVIVLLTSRRKETAPSLPVSLSQKSSALAILEERYAKGEIDRDDYLQRKTDLQGQ